MALTDLSEMNYAKAMLRLQEIAQDLEEGKISIDDMQSIIKESKDLVAFCAERLRQVEIQIEGVDSE